MKHVNFTTSGAALTDTQVARIREEIENTRFRSAWDNGVKLYALDILGDYSKMLDYAKETGGYTPRFIETALLLGAENWMAYSEGGCALIDDGDIARALATPSELARTRDGELPPRGFNTWMSMQVHAHKYASAMIRDILVYGKW